MRFSPDMRYGKELNSLGCRQMPQPKYKEQGDNVTPVKCVQKSEVLIHEQLHFAAPVTNRRGAVL